MPQGELLGPMPGIAAEPQLLSERLVQWAGERAERQCFVFLGDDGQEAGHLTYAGLHHRATNVAAALTQAGLGGAPVLLCVDGSDFVVAFCGCLLAGAIAVPLPATATRRIHERLQRIIADSGATGAVIPGAHPLAAELCGRGLRLVDPATMSGAADRPALPAPTPSAPAFLQYTSGSTGSPKGVVVTHANLAHGAELIGEAFRTTDEDIGVSWLPLHHDMGLVGSVVHIIHRGMRCVHLTPRAMVARPAHWLRAISRYRATISGGPDFAYRLLAERTTAEELRGLDLSCWRIAYTGAEPVRPGTMRRVAGLLASCGFRERAILPCYGLAEATLIVAGGPPELGMAIARPVGGAEGPPYVSCGTPVPAGSVAVIDPDSGLPCREGTVGEIAVAGPHVSPGYWRKEAPPDDAGRIRLAGDARSWYRTGDLGFLHQGGLHISGRIKDLLIINGVKHHAEDVESTVQSEVHACARGAIAAVQVPAGDGPQLVVAIELPQPPTDPDGLVSAVSSAVWRHHGICVDRVLLERTGRLPRTSSGKIRRATTRELIEQGRIGNTVGRP